MRGKHRRAGARTSGRPAGIAVRHTVVVGLVLIALIQAPAAGAQGGDDPADLLQGMEVFTSSCNSCHGDDGSGSLVGRSLIDIAIEQPDRSVHVESVTNGRDDMPAFGDRLTADEIDAAVTYVRLTFVSDGSDLGELPNTGNGRLPAALGLALVLVGGALVVARHGSRVEPGRPGRGIGWRP